MRLTQCIDCGHSVSTEAHQCPRCGSEQPHGINCRYCLQPTRQVDRVHFSCQDSELWRDVDDGTMRCWLKDSFAHRSCLESLLGGRRPCRCCGSTLTPTARFNLFSPPRDPKDISVYCAPPPQRWRPCPNCGDANPFGSIPDCGECGVPILTAQTEVGEKTYHNVCAPQKTEVLSKERHRNTTNNVVTQLAVVAAVVLLGMMVVAQSCP